MTKDDLKEGMIVKVGTITYKVQSVGISPDGVDRFVGKRTQFDREAPLAIDSVRCALVDRIVYDPTKVGVK